MPPSQSDRVRVPVLVYNKYLGPGSDSVYNQQFFCGSCRQVLQSPYMHPFEPDDLEAENNRGLGEPTIWAHERGGLAYFAFCPWCGVEFEDEWWRDRTIQNERAIDHYRNPGTHKGDTHEFRSPASDGEPTWMTGHWLGTTDHRVCWCEPDVEPGIMGCVIRHRDVPMPPPSEPEGFDGDEDDRCQDF